MPTALIALAIIVSIKFVIVSSVKCSTLAAMRVVSYKIGYKST